MENYLRLREKNKRKGAVNYTTKPLFNFSVNNKNMQNPNSTGAYFDYTRMVAEFSNTKKRMSTIGEFTPPGRRFDQRRYTEQTDAFI